MKALLPGDSSIFYKDSPSKYGFGALLKPICFPEDSVVAPNLKKITQ